MSVFFNPRNTGYYGNKNIQPDFTAGRTTAEYQEGFLIGYLHDIKHYFDTPYGISDPARGKLAVSALSSVIAPGISPDFDRPRLCTGMTNIVELHKKTLWTGNGRITDKTHRLFDELYNAGMRFDLRNGMLPKTISCNQYVEELVTFWGFSVVKYPERSTVYLLPIFIDVNIKGDLPLDESSDKNSIADVFGNAANNNGDDIWRRQICDKLRDLGSEQINEFKRGFMDGFHF